MIKYKGYSAKIWNAVFGNDSLHCMTPDKSLNLSESQYKMKMIIKPIFLQVIVLL
jgi:hypothetical protein